MTGANHRNVYKIELMLSFISMKQQHFLINQPAVGIATGASKLIIKDNEDENQNQNTFTAVHNP